MRITIVGGCFPVQHNVDPARLYHATLARQLAAHGPAPSIDVIRYERFGRCLARIEAAAARAPIDVLLFHLRAEPVLRLLKLYYRHLDHAGRVRHALNLPRLGRVPAERFDLLTVRPAQPVPGPPRPPSYAFGIRYLRELNYRLGRGLGNGTYALKAYRQLVLDLADFCRRQHIRLLVMGPVSRPCSAYENRLSAELDAYFQPCLAARGIEYLPALGEADAQGHPLFFPDGIYVSPAGHDRVAARLHAALTAPGRRQAGL